MAFRADLEKLTQLRQTILESIVPLMDSETLEPQERFTLLSQLAQAQGTVEMYEKAFRAAQALEQDDKLKSFMSLLDDVDYEIETVSGRESDDLEQQTENTDPEPAPVSFGTNDVN
jgi:predicted component of type VI protein secretion system